MYLICFDLKIEDELKQSKFQSNLHKAVVNIMFTSGWVYNQFREIFKSYQLTHQQYNVLRILRGRHPEALNPSDIKAVMLDKNPDLTRLCDRLCEMGYIDREIDAVNKRKMNIKINEKGLEILKEIDPKMEHFNNSRFDLTEEEAEQLSALLDKVRG
jgi:DNA-binding MarR family transcriptional regulator